MTHCQNGSELGPVGVLLSDPARWTRGALARDSKGAKEIESSPNAVCWCLYGAVLKCYGRNSGRRTVDELVEAEGKLMVAVRGSIAEWNDAPHRTHAEVMDLLRETGI